MHAATCAHFTCLSGLAVQVTSWQVTQVHLLHIAAGAAEPTPKARAQSPHTIDLTCQQQAQASRSVRRTCRSTPRGLTRCPAVCSPGENAQNLGIAHPECHEILNIMKERKQRCVRLRATPPPPQGGKENRMQNARGKFGLPNYPLGKMPKTHAFKSRD